MEDGYFTPALADGHAKNMFRHMKSSSANHYTHHSRFLNRHVNVIILKLFESIKADTSLRTSNNFFPLTVGGCSSLKLYTGEVQFILFTAGSRMNNSNEDDIVLNKRDQGWFCSRNFIIHIISMSVAQLEQDQRQSLLKLIIIK